MAHVGVYNRRTNRERRANETGVNAALSHFTKESSHGGQSSGHLLQSVWTRVANGGGGRRGSAAGARGAGGFVSGSRDTPPGGAGKNGSGGGEKGICPCADRRCKAPTRGGCSVVRDRNAVRQRDRADADVFRFDRPTLDGRRTRRKGRRRLHIDGLPAWRTGDDPDQHADVSVPPGHGSRRRALRGAGAVEYE